MAVVHEARRGIIGAARLLAVHHGTAHVQHELLVLEDIQIKIKSNIYCKSRT